MSACGRLLRRLEQPGTRSWKDAMVHDLFGGCPPRNVYQVGIEHRSAEKASLSCVGTCQRSHWSRLR